MIHKLTNKDISEQYHDHVFYLSLHDFRGAFAYHLASQQFNMDINLDINKPLKAFTEVVKSKFLESNTCLQITYKELNNVITEDFLGSIPEVLELNNLEKEFFDLSALARNVFYTLCREQITQPL